MAVEMMAIIAVGTIAGYKIDEPVQGLLEAKIGFVRASGSYVDTPIPALNRQADFTGS